jgi:hypothetical protein
MSRGLEIKLGLSMREALETPFDLLVERTERLAELARRELLRAAHQLRIEHSLEIGKRTPEAETSHG